ncbi:hypothetical protein OB69_06370 [Roseivirga seohaensis subsp. aquiponti]|uniref:6-bladed beta-propeller n=1 Tax=Roseivirga seohaensis subsp. aquiponti TaxID=1566026 RepID=A0A0L8ALX5_9BACT|nr:6-bladed beta-propeller [Roseivirga seohaensis]KOF03503.1 hypothetical protein OB69_06370 [Roseivirga seohaensis subsp. aquiponti]
MRINFSVLLLLLTAWSCAEKGASNDKKGTNLDVFHTYKVDIKQNEAPIFDFIEEVEFVRLQETNESLLKPIYKLEIFDDNFIIPESDGSKIYLFDSAGDFKSVIGRRGNGPGEFNVIWDLWMEQDTMFVYDRRSYKVHKYALSGEHYETTKLDISPWHIRSTAKGYVYDMYNQLGNHTTKYNLVFVDDEFNEVQRAQPIQLELGATSFGPDTFQEYEGGLLYQSTFSDTVYQIKEREAIPLFSLDFGDFWFWNTMGEKPNEKKVLEALMRGDELTQYRYFLEKNLIFCYSEYNGKTHRFLIDRRSSKVAKLHYGNGNGEVLGLMPIRWDKDRLLFSIRFSSVSTFISQLNENQIKFRQGTTLEEIESSENPVLLWVKFKALTK